MGGIQYIGGFPAVEQMSQDEKNDAVLRQHQRDAKKREDSLATKPTQRVQPLNKPSTPSLG